MDYRRIKIDGSMVTRTAGGLPLNLCFLLLMYCEMFVVNQTDTKMTGIVHLKVMLMKTLNS